MPGLRQGSLVGSALCDREGESTPPGQWGRPHGADARVPLFGSDYNLGVWGVGIQSSTVTVNQM